MSECVRVAPGDFVTLLDNKKYIVVQEDMCLLGKNTLALVISSKVTGEFVFVTLLLRTGVIGFCEMEGLKVV